MPLTTAFTSVRLGVCTLISAIGLSTAGILLSIPAASLAQSWSSDNPGAFIYQRDVPTRAAQVVADPAAPDQVILSGPESAFDSVMHVADPLTDLEAGAISGQAPTGFNFLLPDAPPSSTDPQNVAIYAGALASSVATATQGTVLETVNQTTALLNSTTSAITGVLSKLPEPGEF